jgi:integrase
MPFDNQRCGPILVTLDGTRWTSDGFRTEFSKARELVVSKAKALQEAATDADAKAYADNMAAIADLRFSDLRGTAATMLRHAGCTIEEISAITGHKRADVSRILDRHYLKNDGSLARAAAAKRQNALQNKLGSLEARLASH